MRLSPCVLVQPDGWARGEREGYGGPCDVTSSLSRRVFGADFDYYKYQLTTPGEKGLGLER